MPEFLAYVSTGEKRYRERFGLDFEQFAVGQKFQHRPGLTLSQQDSRDECLDTLNQQMLHFDEAFAAHTEWKKCLMDSTLTTKVAIGLTWKTFAKRTRLLGFDEIMLTKPVFGGDTLYAESEVLEVRPSKSHPTWGIVILEHRARNQRNETVMRCKRAAMMLRKPNK